jgi:SAM-dependent methyltransferase
MVTIPDDAVPAQGVTAEVAAPSVMAMRIITVGDSDEEAPPEIREEPDSQPAAGAGEPEGAEELLEEVEAAPDSGDAGTLEHAVSLNPEEVTEEAPAKPPPPPRRGAPPPPPSQSARKAARSRKDQPESPPPSAAEISARKPQRRPWWEDLFGEDFVRANARDTDEQISREVNFIEESLGVAPGGVVLDLGCGAGYHAVELASRGYGVVGYDLSLFQLALAADVAHDRGQKLNFLQGDMREMAFEEMFDGVYCWGTTFGYFEEEKNLAVAQRVFRALRPGGMFLLEVANRDFVAMDQPSQVWYEGDSCVCMDDMSVDFITSRLRVKRTMILDDGRTRECNYSVRLYALHELGKLLHDVGFRVTEASGHLATPGVFFGTNSPRIIVLAQKP